MPLDKEIVNQLSEKHFDETIANKITVFEVQSEDVTKFAQAIYDLAIKEERERCATVCDAIHEARNDDCAEAIRKGSE